MKVAISGLRAEFCYLCPCISMSGKKKGRMVHTEVTACLNEMASSYLLLLLLLEGRM